jgi:hypothetical protein
MGICKTTTTSEIVGMVEAIRYLVERKREKFALGPKDLLVLFRSGAGDFR